MEVKIKKLRPDLILPSYAHPGDAGLDVYSLEDYKLAAGELKIFMSGFALEFSDGYVAVVKDRGSFGKASLHTLGGVFDAGFRGEYNVGLINLSKKSYEIKKGDRIAQILILPVARAELKETDNLSDTSRGAGQWGSTGR